MKNLSIISGKGGTGKTSLVACFAALTDYKAVLVDGDVDAANLGLILKPAPVFEGEFRASRVAVIDEESCNSCGLCRELCRFEAISGDYNVDPVSCEGCGFCYLACPCEAVNMKESLSGHWYISETPYGTLVHARLKIAEENSGKLVTRIRNKGRELAIADHKDYLITDGPPGIGCPVIAALSGVDAALIVTEPTISGIHDLERVFAVCRHFGVKAAVCINRFDLEETQAAVIEEFCRKEGIAVAGRISYDRAFVEAMIRGVPVVEYKNGLVSEQIREVWEFFSSFG